MKITLRNAQETFGGRVLRFGERVRAGETVPGDRGDILIGTADPEADAYEETLFSGLTGALGLAYRYGEKAVSIDVGSFAPLSEPCDYYANVMLDALCEWRQTAGDPGLDVCLDCDLRIGDGILARVEEELEKPVIVRQPQLKMSFYGGGAFAKVDRYLQEHPAEKSFRERVTEIVDERFKGKASAVYKRAGVSRSVYSKATNKTLTNYLPTKPTVAALVIGLRSDPDEAQELFHSAGYHLGAVELQDRIVGFFLRERIYDIHELNSCLFAYGLPLLGEHMREIVISPGKD